MFYQATDEYQLACNTPWLVKNFDIFGICRW